MTGDSERPLRLALLHAYDWSEVRRGTERLVGELAGELTTAGHEVTVISAHSGRRRVERRGGARVILNRRLPSAGPLRRHALAHIPASWATLRSGRYDLAHAFHPSDALAALGWGEAAGRPVVFSVPAFPPAEPGVLRGRALARVFTRAASVVVPTQSVGGAVRRDFPQASIAVIAPGVDTEVFSPGPGRAGTPVVFCAADLSERRKQVEGLVSAFGDVREVLPNARLVLANPHPGRAAPAWSRAAGVEVRPMAGDEELAGAYRNAWVCALPAVREPFGLVLAEAMACGTPVIGSAADGIPEVIGSGPQGVCIEPGDRKAWAAALLGALREPPPPAVSEAARERGAGFSTARCRAAYEALYRRLIQTGMSGGGGPNTGRGAPPSTFG